jgi:hypothetical protein
MLRASAGSRPSSSAVVTSALEGRPGKLLEIHGSEVTVGALESAERPAIEGG